MKVGAWSATDTSSPSLAQPRSRFASAERCASVTKNRASTSSVHAEFMTLTDDELIQATLERQEQQRERVFSQDLPFSWLRLVVGLVSVAFVLTDVPRSGLGIKSLKDHYPVLEPDTAVATGAPWNYSVFRATKEEAANETVRLWSYKFDTTSIIWRAFSRHLKLQAMPSCLSYHEPCPSEYLDGDVVFNFVDGLVNAIASRPPPYTPPAYTPPTPPSPDLLHRLRPRFAPTLTLRTEHEYIDRVHDYLLPWFFSIREWRTNNALHYPPFVIAGGEVSNACQQPTRPIFCQDLWIQYRRSCPASMPQCRAVGHLYTHTMQRVRAVQARFPDASVDLTILESAEDIRVSRASVSSNANRRFDVSTIIRARKCPQAFTRLEDCKTIYVDDYRYELEIITSDVVQWYRLVVALRLVGQVYFYLRVFGLVASCYYALASRTATRKEPQRQRLSKMFHLLTKVPTQCVVFGSPFPIACYAAAHIIDASMMYMMLEKRFLTENGILDLKLREFISVAVIQMRSVWIYALLLHAAVQSSTWHRVVGWGHGVVGGITGVPEFFLTGLSCVTISAQFRSTYFRSARVLSIQETVSVGGKAARAAMHIHSFARRGSGNFHIGGVLIDLKFLICLVAVVVLVSHLRAVILRIRMRDKRSKPVTDLLYWPLGRTPVPYSAGTLWPTVSLCVHWTSDFFCIHNAVMQEELRIHPVDVTRNWSYARFKSARIGPEIQTEKATGPLNTQCCPVFQHMETPSVRMSSNTFRFIQHHMELLHRRSEEVEGNIAFMNLVVMSDPLVYFLLRFSDNTTTTVAYFQSMVHPDKVMLLPEAAVTVENEQMCYLRMLRRMQIGEMSWSDLVQCG